MRATPPSRRMSAGTRSSAITAHAPASSAMRACSGVTTSMITPPLSICAKPAFTAKVPVCALLPFVYPLLPFIICSIPCPIHQQLYFALKEIRRFHAGQNAGSHFNRSITILHEPLSINHYWSVIVLESTIYRQTLWMLSWIGLVSCQLMLGQFAPAPVTSARGLPSPLMSNHRIAVTVRRVDGGKGCRG